MIFLLQKNDKAVSYTHLPRKKLGYRTPEELFDEFLDSVYAAEGCGSIAQDGSQRLPS